MPESKIDTLNKFAVGAAGEGIAILGRIPPRIPKADALLLAAHLVALADDDPGGEDSQFARVLEAVLGA